MQLTTGDHSFLYDPDADVVYINLAGQTESTDSELTPDDIIVRYNGEDVIGFTLLHASKRSGGAK